LGRKAPSPSRSLATYDLVSSGSATLSTSAERDRDSLLAIVEDLLQIAVDDRDPSEIAEDAEGELVAHPVDDRGAIFAGQKPVAVNL
jgi:hypothetical protein